MGLNLRRYLLLGLMLVFAWAPTLHRAHAVETPPRVGPGRPPLFLSMRLHALGSAFDGRIGIAVTDLQGGWTTAYRGTVWQPQQSVSKLWVAVTVLDAVDRGVIKLDDPVTVTREDMSVFNQPIQQRLKAGPYRTTVDGLLVYAIAESDNAANDMLVRLVGGPEVVQALVKARGLDGIRAGMEERVLQARIAAVDWKPEYSFGQAFWNARDQIPMPVRIAALNAYLADPEDGATAEAMVRGLARLKRGELLSPASTQRLLDIMAKTETGPMRLKAGIVDGWSIAHKTGTGQDLGELSTGFNDVGLLTAPDGHLYAVAVMIAATTRPVPERQSLMSDVARAVVDEHNVAQAATTVAQTVPAG